MKVFLLGLFLTTSLYSQTLSCLKFELRQEGTADVTSRSDNAGLKQDRPISVYAQLKYGDKAVIYSFFNIFNMNGVSYHGINVNFNILPKVITGTGWKKLFEINSSNSSLVMGPGNFEFVTSVTVFGVEPLVCKAPEGIKFYIE